MNTKSILAVSMAVVCAVSAQAATLHISGATSFRKAVNAALIAKYPDAKVAYVDDGTSKIANAKYAVYDDSANSGDVVLTSFSGSVEGIQALDESSTVKFIDVAQISNFTGTATAPQILSVSPAMPATQDLVPDCAFSDVFQASTDYQTQTLNDEMVGVVPFLWVVNSTGASKFTNITTQLAYKTLSSSAKLSMFTGSAADSTKTVYSVGRNKMSGTRLTAVSEIKYPAGTGLQQRKPTFTSGTITALPLWESGSGYLAGDNGYSSGGDVATAINAPLATSLANYVLISYIGTSDASKITNGAILSFNGVPYSEAAVYNGQYTFWGYEHMFYVYLDDEQAAIKDAIVADIQDHLIQQSCGLPITSMSVGRDSDGDIVYSGNPW